MDELGGVIEDETKVKRIMSSEAEHKTTSGKKNQNN